MKKDELNEITDELYPQGRAPSAEDDEDIPSGFKLLYAMITVKSSDLFGLAWIPVRKDEQGAAENEPSTQNHSDNLDNKIYSVVGIGTFSCVLVAETNSDCVLKISRTGRKSHLANEVGCLKTFYHGNEEFGRIFCLISRRWDISESQLVAPQF